MANNFLTISMITREALRVLENELTFTKQINRNYDDRFGVAGAKIGTVINIRKPPRYKGRTGQALAPEDAVETSVPLALTTQRGVDLLFTSQDLTLNIDDFSKRFLKPAVANVANGVDFDGTGLTLQCANMIGTPGTFPSAALTYLQAGQRLNEEACPVDDRRLVMGPGFVPPIVDALKGLFQSSERIAEQYDKGQMGIGLGFRWYMDQNMRTQVAGAGGAATVSGANQTGNSLVTTGWPVSTAIFNAGDIITLPTVFAVNPVNKQQSTFLRQFVVTANVTSAASGTTTIPIAPAIIPPTGGTINLVLASNTPLSVPNTYTQSVTVGGGFQNVTNSPANGAAITVVFTAGQSSGQACAFHPEAFAMGCADLLLPGGVDMASRVSDDQLGLSIRAVRAYDINNDRFPTRLDILYGFCVLYQEMACRIAGA